jgi:hypothetical protein
MTLTVAVSKRLPLLETGLGDADSISTAQRNVYSAIREQIRKSIYQTRSANPDETTRALKTSRVRMLQGSGQLRLR